MRDAGLFEPNGPGSRKVRCRECGASGYPGGSWQVAHRAGHESCPDCGARRTVRAMPMHRAAHHRKGKP